MIKKTLLFLTLIIFIGCGGGSNSSSNNSNNSDNVTSTLIDSPISGVEFTCGNNSGLTDSNGNFTCKENCKVYFSIGGVKLGNTTINKNNLYITPARLFNLDNSNISDTRIVNFVQFIQSLDSDNNISNGINIDANTRKKLINSTLDITNPNTTENNIKNILQGIGKTLIQKNQAIENYIETLKKTLHIIFKPEPYYYQQWYIDKNLTFYSQNNIDPNASINTGNLLRSYNGKGVKIAIIDDGLDITHEDLKGAIIKTYNISTKNSNVSHTNEDGFHGTAVTGIIGARVNGKGIQGIASGADIIFLKYKENMSDSETIELFNKAEEFGADIINCSWGTYDVSQAVKEKIQDLARNGRNGKGIPIVFAVGNDDKNMGNDESAIPEVIAVGSSNKNNLRSWYSNYGKNLDIMAPGGYDVGITTLDDMGDNGLASIDKNYFLYNDPNPFIGTSASAPIVTASIALLLEKNPNLTRVEIENILKNSSDKIGDIPYENGRNNYYGYGKLNLQKAMKLVK
jgi:subtilisin family serine protease